MNVKIKICGLTTLEDTLDAIELGADYLGFNFYPDSPRYVSPEQFTDIIQEVPTELKKVGVFVNADPQYVIDIATAFNLDLLQFHGDETPTYCNQFARPYIKAFRPKDSADLMAIGDYACDYILIDSFVENAYGGTGILGNWELSREAKKQGALFLSGGLKPENVDIAVQTVKPFAVDVASGVESSLGKKDYRKMEEFIKRVRGG